MAAELAVKFLERQRSDSSFDEFYTGVVESSRDLTSPSCLPRYRTPPRQCDDGSASHQFTTQQSYFRKQYFEVLDLLNGDLIKNEEFQLLL